MRHSMILTAGIMLLLGACSNNGNSKGTNQLANAPTPLDTNFITLDTGNKMINSYLNSINYTVNDTDVRSFIVDAGALKKYLDSAQNITQIKIFFAHTLSYINSGHENQFAGYQSGALTLILAGVNDSGNYVYYPGDMVIDHSAHCPSNCPPGSAGNNTLTLPSIRN